MKRVLLFLLSEMMILFPALSGLPNRFDTASEGLHALSKAEEATLPVQYDGISEGDDAPVSLKIGTYNIHNGQRVAYDYAVLASDILTVGLDVCGLQEVDQNTLRNGGRDTMKLLSEATGCQYYAFAKAIEFDGGEYGTAILSKYPIVSFETVLLESGRYEQRAYGHAVLLVNGTTVDVYNTHFCYQDAWQRGRQFAAIAEELAGKTRWVLTGDFNARDYSEYACIADSLLVNNEENKMISNHHDYPADNIVLPSGATVMASGCYDQATHSDHSMIWADVVLP